jgi:hypothetical protein
MGGRVVLYRQCHSSREVVITDEVPYRTDVILYFLGERQAVVPCLISKVVVTAEQVEISYVLPFEGAPQVVDRPGSTPGGTPGHVYRLRLAHLDLLQTPIN